MTSGGNFINAFGHKCNDIRVWLTITVMKPNRWHMASFISPNTVLLKAINDNHKYNAAS